MSIASEKFAAIKFFAIVDLRFNEGYAGYLCFSDEHINGIEIFIFYLDLAFIELFLGINAKINFDIITRVPLSLP